MPTRFPNTARQIHTESDRTRAWASTGVRRRSTSSAIIRHASASGRTTVSPVGSTEDMRSTRNVRRPASVPATRYQPAPLAARPSGWTTRVVSAPSRARYPRVTCWASTTARCTASSSGGVRRGAVGRSQPWGSTMTAVDAASAESRNGSGRARTSLRSAALTSGVAADAGPATRNRARASDAVSPLRSVRPPPASCQPPLRPWRE